jgi:hypothetical protein
MDQGPKEPSADECEGLLEQGMTLKNEASEQTALSEINPAHLSLVR